MRTWCTLSKNHPISRVWESSLATQRFRAFIIFPISLSLSPPHSHRSLCIPNFRSNLYFVAAQEEEGLVLSFDDARE